MSSQFNDTEDDLPLRRRTDHEAYTRSETRAPEMVSPPADREVTLNTGLVLGLFFALAILCAVFFGFGYSIGHKSAPVAVATSEPEIAVSETAASSTPAKATPTSPQVVPQYVPGGNADKPSAAMNKPAEPAVQTVRVPVPPTPAKATLIKPPPAAPIVRTPAPVVETAVISTAPPTPGSSYVQVAAVSHQEDANVLVSSLRRRNYAVLTRSDPADKLIHVQVGPFGTRKEADAMRQRLAGDGYNAFIK